jgi:hypothetical protein
LKRSQTLQKLFRSNSTVTSFGLSTLMPRTKILALQC